MEAPVLAPKLKSRVSEAILALAGPHATIEEYHWRHWASIIFVGGRHKLRILFAGPEGVAASERFIQELPDHEFALPRHLVADAAVLDIDHNLSEPSLSVRVELLLLEDA